MFFTVPLKDVLPPNRVHLLAGVSDAGKTRFIIPAMLAWSPPWAYVAGDRSILDAYDTMNDMGIPLSNVPLIPAFGRDNKAWPQIIAAATNMSPLPEILVVEGFQDLCDSRNEAKVVRDFLAGVDAYLQPTREFPNGLTVVGVAESSKMRPQERYADPRQRVSGCSAWVYHASTVLLIESSRKDLELLGPERRLYICTKKRGRRHLDGAFDAQNQLVFPNL